LTLKQRTGFFKLALKHGATILPVLSFGEVDIYHQIRRPWLKRIQIVLMEWMTIAIPLFYSRFWLIPDSKKLTSVVGLPITIDQVIEDPTLEDVRKLQDRYISALMSLHQKHSVNVPFGKCSLTIK
jgi:1-acyl-sn-glycerol-3-phosphate acyltransferase